MALRDFDMQKMAEKMQEMMHELEMMTLQQEIDALQREIDMATPRPPTASAPYGDGRRTVTVDRSFIPSSETEVKHEPGMTPFPKMMMQRPRRLLPKTPPEIRHELSVNRGCQTDMLPDEILQKFVTERRKPTTEEKTTSQTVDKAQGGNAGPGRGVMMRPATYDGSNPWTDYRAHFDACATLNGWNDKQKGLYLSVSLRGQAQGVFGNLDAGSSDYSSLVQALEERFAPPNQTELYRVQLKSRQQKAAESMAELGQDIRRLTILAYPSAPNDVRETLAKEQFMDALVNAEMRLKIKQARPKDLNDTVRHAVELESFYRAEKRQQGLVLSTMSGAEPSTTDARDIKQTLNQVQETLQRIDTANQKGDRRANTQTEHRSQWGRQPQDAREYAGNSYDNKQGWNKQNPGPYRTDGRSLTSSKPKCYECGSEQHLRRDCQAYHDRVKQQNSKYRNCKKSGLASSAGLYAKAKVDGISTDCLVDTGASLTLISNKLWELIEDKHTLSSFSTPIISASGDAMIISGRTEVLLEFEDIRCPVTVVVADMDINIVLGIDFMKSCKVRIDVTRNVMTVKGKDIPLLCVGKIGLNKLSGVIYAVDCGRNKVGQTIHCDRIRRCKEQRLLGETDSDDTVLDNSTVETGDEASFPHDNDVEVQDVRVRRKPVCAQDYVFSLSSGKMPATKVTPRRQTLGLCSCCSETVTGDLTEHMKTCPKRLPCQLCKKTFLKAAYLKKHLNDTHRNITEAVSTSRTSEIVPIEEDWDKDPDVEVGDNENLDNDDGKESETSCNTDDLLEGRMFRKSTTPMLPVQKKRPDVTTEGSVEKSASVLLLSKRPAASSAAKPGTSGQSEQKKKKVEQKKRVRVMYEGDMQLNLGQLVGEGMLINASNVTIELKDEVLKVDIQY